MQRWSKADELRTEKPTRRNAGRCQQCLNGLSLNVRVYASRLAELLKAESTHTHAPTELTAYTLRDPAVESARFMWDLKMHLVAGH